MKKELIIKKKWKVKSILLQTINFDSPRGGISLVTEKGVLTTSRLLVQKAIQSDSGVYTCDPSNANPTSVRVHILNGKSPFYCIFDLNLKLKRQFTNHKYRNFLWFENWEGKYDKYCAYFSLCYLWCVPICEIDSSVVDWDKYPPWESQVTMTDDFL